ncbi:hypothetical protein StrepF001_22375 [Streptomyces sp. F001]|nr:hypothetical protein StrepF001_22375 [Streptomyces sp. F001]
MHRLTYLDDGDETVVGRLDVDSYAVFPPDGVALLRELESGRTPSDAAAWYAERYGEPVDMAEFLTTLRELGFVRQEGDLLDNADELGGREAVRWQRLGRALFSPFAWICYIALVAAAVAVCLVDPRMVPHQQNVFFTDYLTVVGLTILFGQIPLTLLHELFHVLAGRRLGIRSGVRLGRRFYFVVFETALDGLVAVPRRKRYLPMLAGLLADVLVIAGLIVVAYVTRYSNDGISMLGGICLALAFTTLPRMVWQFYFFLRTDVYYLISTVLGCVDLQTVTRELLGNRVNALLGRRDRLVDESRWHPRDQRVARWYAPFQVMGYAFAIATLLFVVVPLAWQFFGTALRTIASGGALPTSRFWDAAAVLGFSLFEPAIAAVLFLRERFRRAAGHQGTTT